MQRPRKRGNPEGKIVLSIIKELRARGWQAYKIKVQGSPRPGGGFIFDPYRITGLGDILCFKTNMQLFNLEVKTSKNDTTSNQDRFAEIWHYPPTRIYAVVRSISDTLEILEKHRLP